jgi:hypothetical protein
MLLGALFKSFLNTDIGSVAAVNCAHALTKTTIECMTCIFKTHFSHRELCDQLAVQLMEEVDHVAPLRLEEFMIVARKCSAAKFEEYFQTLGFCLMPIWRSLVFSCSYLSLI